MVVSKRPCQAGSIGLLQSVFYYKPEMQRAKDRVVLCHPAVWEFAKERIDTNKLEQLALLSCYSADEK